MKTRTLGSVLAIIVLSAGACVLPGLHDLGGTGGGGASSASVTGGSTTAVATTSSGTSSSSGSGAPEPCEDVTDVSFLLANVAASNMAIDFCFRTSVKNQFGEGVAYWNGAKDGLKFGQSIAYPYDGTTISVNGPMDIKVIKVDGSSSCSESEGLFEDTGMCVTDPSGSNSVSLYYLTDTNGKGFIVNLHNHVEYDKSKLRVRFLNAVSDAASLDFGSTATSMLPTSVHPVLLNVPFAQPIPQQLPPLGELDEDGYLVLMGLPPNTQFHGWGAALSGSNGSSAIAVAPFEGAQVMLSLGKILTVVATGTKSASEFKTFDETILPKIPTDGQKGIILPALLP